MAGSPHWQHLPTTITAPALAQPAARRSQGQGNVTLSSRPPAPAPRLHHLPPFQAWRQGLGGKAPMGRAPLGAGASGAEPGTWPRSPSEMSSLGTKIPTCGWTSRLSSLSERLEKFICRPVLSAAVCELLRTAPGHRK